MTRTALVVPLRVDLLVVDHRDPEVPTVTAGPLADFTRLPFHDGRRDVHPGRPYLAEEIAAAPFEEAAARLPTGVHLHWALPAALSRGRHRRAGDGEDSGAHESTVGGLDFPRVPNRWLVEAPDGWWVVESDYLHPEGSRSAAVPYLLPPSQRGRAPWRRLGRQVPLAEWRPHDPAAEYLDGLTAVGWGHPAFHAFHPSCHSVFGFHHDTLDLAAAARFPYRVFGWFSQLAHDPVAAHPDLLAEFGWEPMGSGSPGRLLCAGTTLPPARARVAVDRIVLGATGTEALAAHAAQELHDPLLTDTLSAAARPRARALYEELLESVVLGSALDPDRPDALAALRRARHAQEFVAVPGDRGWTVRARRIGAADAAQAPHGVPGTVPAVHRLAELGRVSAHRDRLDRRRAVLRARLHADWCAYLQCKYPPPGSGLDRPDVDELRRFLQIDSLAAVETVVAEAEQATAELAAIAAEIHAELAAADAADCEVTAADVADWAELVQPAQALGLLPERLAQQVRDRPADEGLRAAVLAAFHAIVRGPGLPPRVPADRLARVVPDQWLRTGGVPDGLDRTVATLFPDGGPAARAWRETAAAQTESVRTALRNRIVLESMLAPHLAATKRVRHELDTRPGPRFWRPRDPVLLLTGSAVAPTDRHSGTGATVRCPLAPIGADPAASLVAALSDRRSRLAQAFELVREVALKAGESSAWHPIMADWKVAVHEEMTGGYDEGYLEDRYELADPDLQLRDPTTTSAGRVAVVSGRGLLSPHPAGALQHALSTRRPRQTDADRAVDGFLTSAEELIARTDLQAVSLGGLHAGLLMHEPVLPLDLADPHGFGEAQAFAARVAAAAGPHAEEAPRPMMPFLPLRSGRLQLLGLRLLDTFGRVLDVPLPGTPITAAESMPTTTIGEGTDVFAMPPRLLPPTRLHLRWQAAERAGEAHDHPSTGAVCGWLVPDLLDDTLAVHAPDGTALGSVDEDGRWWPAPGDDRIVPPEDIANPHLRRLVVHLLHLSTEDRRAVFVAVDEAVEGIEPDSHAQHRAIGLLAGRPLAVVRASLRLDVLGSLPVERSWAALRAATRGGSRGDANLRSVRFPVRLGDPTLLDDGVVGFWAERGGELAGMQVAGETRGLTLDGPAQTLTMLVDPRAAVHAVTGILPGKVLRVPPEQFVPALKGIAVTFPASPLLTDPETVRVAVPVEPGYEWSWLERTPAGWVELHDLAAVRTEASLAAQQELREGWLRLRPVAEA